jgi:hypothetical protein
MTVAEASAWALGPPTTEAVQVAVLVTSPEIVSGTMRNALDPGSRSQGKSSRTPSRCESTRS